MSTIVTTNIIFLTYPTKLPMFYFVINVAISGDNLSGNGVTETIPNGSCRYLSSIVCTRETKFSRFQVHSKLHVCTAM